MRLRILILLLCFPLIATATKRYVVASGGIASGNATTLGTAWTLKWALDSSNVAVAGDTIELQGGTYLGKFTATLVGSAGSPIIIRGKGKYGTADWAKIDGFYTTTIAAPMSVDSVYIQLTDASEFFNYMTAIVDTEWIYLEQKTGNRFYANRGNGGTDVKAYAIGTQVAIGGNVLTATGTYMQFENFEVCNSDTMRYFGTANTQDDWRKRGICLWWSGNNNKFINLILHDGNCGAFGSAGTCTSGEMYGCIVYNNGYYAAGYNNHGLYIQNAAGGKQVKESIFFNNADMGVQAVSQTGNTMGLYFEGVLSFNNGSIDSNSTTRRNNWLIGTNDGVATDDTVIACFGYNPDSSNAGGITFGYGAAQNGTMVLRNSYMAGGRAVVVDKWDTITVTGNTFATRRPDIGNMDLGVYGKSNNANPYILWDSNTYFNSWTATDQDGFYYNGSTGLYWAGWLDSVNTWDAASSFTRTAPTTNWKFFRANAYDSTRGHIFIYNWQDSTSVSVNVSSEYANGEGYKIRDVQNYSTVYDSGMVRGGYVVINMTKFQTFATRPVGWRSDTRNVGPDFAAFVIEDYPEYVAPYIKHPRIRKP